MHVLKEEKDFSLSIELSLDKWRRQYNWTLVLIRMLRELN